MVSIVGLEAAIAKLSALTHGILREAGDALREEGEIEMTEAKARTPVWNPARPLPPGHTPGSLRNSGHVTGPVIDGQEVSVTLSFGGEVADYAIFVHEDMDAFHATGQSKYLESVVLESEPYLAARVAARIDLNRAIS